MKQIKFNYKSYPEINFCECIYITLFAIPKSTAYPDQIWHVTVTKMNQLKCTTLFWMSDMGMYFWSSQLQRRIPWLQTQSISKWILLNSTLQWKFKKNSILYFAFYSIAEFTALETIVTTAMQVFEIINIHDFFNSSQRHGCIKRP